jgi:hypothetical protein
VEYKKIGSLLDKFRSIIAASGLEKGAITSAIREATGIAVPEDALRISGTTLYIRVSGSQKTAIMLKKQLILDTINQSRKRSLENIS